MEIPADFKIRYLIAPNLDINIIKLFHLLSLSKDLSDNDNKVIIESHQKEKQPVGGI